jgi:hypothetical protein
MRMTLLAFNSPSLILPLPCLHRCPGCTPHRQTRPTPRPRPGGRSGSWRGLGRRGGVTENLHVSKFPQTCIGNNVVVPRYRWWRNRCLLPRQKSHYKSAQPKLGICGSSGGSGSQTRGMREYGSLVYYLACVGWDILNFRYLRKTQPIITKNRRFQHEIASYVISGRIYFRINFRLRLPFLAPKGSRWHRCGQEYPR